MWMLKRVQQYYSGLEYIMRYDAATVQLIRDMGRCVRLLGNRRVNSHITFDLRTDFDAVVALELSAIDVPYNVVGGGEYSSSGVELPWISARRGGVSPFYFGEVCASIEDVQSTYPCAYVLDLATFDHPPLPQHHHQHREFLTAQWRLRQLHARSGGRVDLALDWLYSLDRRNQV